MNFRRAVYALALSAAFTSAASAADEPPVVQALFKTWETHYNIKPTYKNLTNQGDTILIEGLEATIPAPAGAESGGAKLALGKLELKAVSDQGNGLYLVDNATWTDLNVSLGQAANTVSIAIPSTVSEGWYVKTPADSAAPAEALRASMNLARTTSSGPITFTSQGQTIKADGYEMTWEGDPQTGAGKTSFKLSNIAVPENVVAMIDPSGTLKQLGYGALAFDIGGDGKLDLASDKLGFDFDMFYTGRDMGTLKLGAAAGEVPLAFVGELQKREGQDMSKLMPLAQGITVSRVTFRFEDQSITKRVLPLAAKMQGMDEQTLIANAGAMVQVGLMQLKNPAFTQQVVAAVNAFLRDPRSFTIAAKPSQPVSVMQVMSLDPANPGAAIERLGVSVTANN
jgi:hypothetical protein